MKQTIKLLIPRCIFEAFLRKNMGKKGRGSFCAQRIKPMFTHFSEDKNMGKKGKEEKKDSEDHNVHTLLGQPALVQIVDRGLTGKSDQEKKVIIDIIFNLICVTF